MTLPDSIEPPRTHAPPSAGRRAVPLRILELRSVRGTGGGPEKTILFGAARSNPRRFAVTVCYIRDQRDEIFGIDERAKALGVDYVELRERHSFDWSIWPALRRLVRARAIDIVHSHDYKTNLFAWLLWRSGAALALSTVHGWTGHTRRERRLYYPLDKRLLVRFPRLIAVSAQIRETLLLAGADRGRVSVLLNGIDPDAFRREPGLGTEVRRSLGLQPTDVVVGTVGRLEPQKRFDLLMTAFAAIRRPGDGRRLVIAGDGSLRGDLEALARELGLGESCLLIGLRADVARLHHAFDVFVQSSDYEGTSNAVLEAMAMETPVVATDVGGTREILNGQSCGALIPAGDAAILAEAIERTLTDPAAAAGRVRAARNRIEQELSFEHRMRGLERTYEELAARRTRAKEMRAHT